MGDSIGLTEKLELKIYNPQPAQTYLIHNGNYTETKTGQEITKFEKTYTDYGKLIRMEFL